MTLLLEVMSFKPQPTGGENQYCSDVCDQVLLEELDSFIGDTGVKIVFWGGQVLRRESIRCVQAVFLGGVLPVVGWKRFTGFGDPKEEGDGRGMQLVV